MKTEKELKPLIDLDILQYRCGFAADAEIKREAKAAYPGINDEDLAKILAEQDYLTNALQNTKTVLEAVTERFNPNHQSYIQGKGNFRYDIATIKPYKGNRDKSHKPKYYSEIKSYLLEKWRAFEVHGQEADDAIGIEQFDNSDKYTVIVSTDKDMMMIPGWHYNWVKNELVYQPIQAANNWLFHQMMEGDSTDNIPGIAGIGKKTAPKIIESFNHDTNRIREEVKKLYQKQYGEGWEQAYWEIANLLWIRRHPNEECTLL